MSSQWNGAAPGGNANKALRPSSIPCSLLVGSPGQVLACKGRKVRHRGDQAGDSREQNSWSKFTGRQRSRVRSEVLMWEAVHTRYGLRVCVPPKPICWSPNSQCGGVRRQDHGVIRSWVQNSHDEICALLTEGETQELSRHSVRTQQEYCHLQTRKRGDTRHRTCRHLSLGF